jgi:hypothetical protein
MRMAPGSGNAGRFRLGADVDHVRLAGGVEMGQRPGGRFSRWIHEIPCHNSFLRSRYHSDMKLHPLAGALVLCFGMVLAPPLSVAEGLPNLGEAAQAELSPAMERRIGESVMLEIRRDPAWLDDPEVSGYLNRLGNRLCRAERGIAPGIRVFRACAIPPSMPSPCPAATSACIPG